MSHPSIPPRGGEPRDPRWETRVVDLSRLTGIAPLILTKLAGWPGWPPSTDTLHLSGWWAEQPNGDVVLDPGRPRYDLPGHDSNWDTAATLLTFPAHLAPPAAA